MSPSRGRPEVAEFIAPSLEFGGQASDILPRWHHYLLAAALGMTCLNLLFMLRPRSPITSYHTLPAVTTAPAGSEERPRWRIGLLSMTTSETSYDHYAWGLKQQYAQRHGYTMIWDFGKKRDNILAIYSDKYRAIDDVIVAYHDKLDWVLWMDYDTLITNASVKLEDIIDSNLARIEHPDEVHVMATRECRGWNSGVFLLRPTQWVRDIFNDVVACAKRRSYSVADQDCLFQEVKPQREQKEGITRWHFIHQHLINGYLRYRCDNETLKEQGAWTEGDLLIHFAGAHNWAWQLDEAQGDSTAKSDSVGWLMRCANFDFFASLNGSTWPYDRHYGKLYADGIV